MASYCVLVPHIKTQDGKFQESNLFKELLSLTSRNRDLTKRVYSILNDEGVRRMHGRQLEYDSLGEPTLESALKIPQVKKYIDDGIITEGIIAKLGGRDKNGIKFREDTLENFEELSKRVVDFNNTDPLRNDFVATVETSSDGLYISAARATDENTTKARKLATNLALNAKIRTILSNSGISLSALNSLEERAKLNGVLSYDTATYTNEGIINLIKLAEGIRGEEALPEEFAHLVIDMMNEDPMVKRLMSLLDNESVMEQVFGEEWERYSEEYEDDFNRLKREAAGKLVYQSWFNENNPLSKHKSFINKLIDSIKNFITKTFSRDSFNNAFLESQKLAENIGIRILEREDLGELDLQTMRAFSNLEQLNRDATDKKKLLAKAMSNTLKRYQFYTRSLEAKIKKELDPDKKEYLQEQLDMYYTKMREHLNRQKELYDIQQFDEGIQNFITLSTKDVKGLQNRLNNVKAGMSIQEAAYNLRNVANFINGILPIAQDINTALQYPDADLQLSDTDKQAVRALLTDLETIRGQYVLESQRVFAEFLKDFFPEEGINLTSNGKARRLTRDDIDRLVKTADQDTDILDTFIQSAANSNDVIIRLADSAMKESKERKRQRVLDIRERLFAAAKELNDSGSSDEILFETHADGSMSGRYKSTTNWTAYYDARDAEIKALSEKYGEDSSEFRKAFNAWKRQNENELGYPNAKYTSDPYAGMTEAQKKYYDVFMEIRKELISYLPLSTLEKDPMRAVQITKELWERLKSSSINTWGKQLARVAQDTFFVRIDDTQFGFKEAKRGFNGEELLSIPIFFVNQIEREEDLSRDTVSTMLAFADMAINYDEMSKVVEVFEVGRDVMEKRTALVQRRGNPLVERVKDLGIRATQPITSGSNKNFVRRYNEFLKTQLYSRFMDDSGVDISDNKRVSSGKTAQFLTRISALNQLALNALAGLAALGTDAIAVNSEVLAGAISNGKGLFNAKQLWEADKIYRREVVKVLGEFGNPIKTSKLGLFIEKFDVLHEYENMVRNVDWKKGRLKKLFSENSLYFFMQAGAHWGETRTALAQAQNIKIKSDDGTREESLWDVLEVEYIDASNPERGARLKAKEGFTLSQKDIKAYTRKFAGLNQRLYGIYSKTDTNTLQNTAIGQLVFLYRKFIIPAVNRRYGRTNYNFDLGETTEGYYRSAFNFLKNVITDSKNLSRNIAMYWDSMEDFERSNCLRAANELGTFAILAGVAAALKGADWDDKKNPWSKRLLAYMSRRVGTEVGAFSPFGVTGELWDILKSPSAAINTLESAGDVLGCLLPGSWVGEDSVVKNGRYKGLKKGTKYLLNSPFVPMNKTIYRVFHPEEGMIAFQ